MIIQETRIYKKDGHGTQSYIVVLARNNVLWVAAVYEKEDGTNSGMRALSDREASAEMTRILGEGWERVEDIAPTGTLPDPLES